MTTPGCAAYLQHNKACPAGVYADTETYMTLDASHLVSNGRGDI